MRRIASSVLATIKEQEMILYSETRPIFCIHLKQAAKKTYTSKNNAYIFSLCLDELAINENLNLGGTIWTCAMMVSLRQKMIWMV